MVKDGYTVYCRSEIGGKNQGKGQGGVGLAMKQTLDTQTTARLPNFISEFLCKVTLNVRGQAKAMSFVVANASTETTYVARKNKVCCTGRTFSLTIIRFDGWGWGWGCQRIHRVERGEEGVRSKDKRVLGAYDRDTLNDNGRWLLTSSANYCLVLVNTLFQYLQWLWARKTNQVCVHGCPPFSRP